MEQPPETDVVVLGAGTAGVAAGRELANRGLDVVVVEARERVGGRVWTVRDFAGTAVEGGAEFIHGVGATTWTDVRAAGLRVQPVPYRYSWLDIGGSARWLPLQLVWPDTWPAFSILWALRHWKKDDISAAAFMDHKRYRGRAKELAGLTLAAHLPGGLDEIGIMGLVADGVVTLEVGLNHRVVDGYDGLPRYIARELDVRLGWRVAQVSWAPDSVEVRSDDGRTIAARAAVCALPHGVLDAGDITFDPVLPPTKADAIRRIRTGPVAKVLLHFDEVFWPRRMAQVASGSGPVTLYWATSFGTDGPPVLSAYATGPRARALSEAGAGLAAEIALDDLARIYPGAPTRQLVKDVRFIDWLSDPFARGGYTFLSPGGVGARAALAAPDTGALFWCGSATVWSPVADTVEAAFNSGVQAAEQAAAQIGVRSSTPT